MVYTKFKRVERFNGIDGYLEDKDHQPVVSHSFEGYTFLIDDREEKVYKLVKDCVSLHTAIVVPVRDAELTKRVMESYVKEVEKYVDEYGNSIRWN